LDLELDAYYLVNSECCSVKSFMFFVGEKLDVRRVMVANYGGSDIRLVILVQRNILLRTVNTCAY